MRTFKSALLGAVALLSSACGQQVVEFPIAVGTIHAGDPAAATAIADLTTADTDAAGRTLCRIASVTLDANLIVKPAP